VIANVAAALVLCGAVLACLGSLGLLRLKTFYERVHPPTLGSTMGAVLVLAGSMLHFTALGSRPVIHEILIAVMLTATTPVTYMLLVRAALARDGTGDAQGEKERGAEAPLD
jgi:multicomponent K+:H+ antiporter subunit G